MVDGGPGARTVHAQGLVEEEWDTEAGNVTIQRKFDDDNNNNNRSPYDRRSKMGGWLAG